jgi:large conductance mechanosensitive channel protein
MIGKVDKAFTEAVRKADGTIDTTAKVAEVVKNADGSIPKVYAAMLTNPNGSTMSYAEARTHGPALGYGAFITETLNFLIMAFVVFLMVKAYTAAKKRFEAEKPAPAPAPAGPSEKDYLKEIRDLLARK